MKDHMTRIAVALERIADALEADQSGAGADADDDAADDAPAEKAWYLNGQPR